MTRFRISDVLLLHCSCCLLHAQIYQLLRIVHFRRTPPERRFWGLLKLFWAQDDKDRLDPVQKSRMIYFLRFASTRPEVAGGLGPWQLWRGCGHVGTRRYRVP